MAQSIQKNHVVALPSHEKCLGSRAGCRPRLNELIDEILRIVSEDQHGNGPILPLHGGEHIRMDRAVGGTVVEVAENSSSFPDRLFCEGNGQRFDRFLPGIAADHASAVRRSHENALVAVIPLGEGHRLYDAFGPSRPPGEPLLHFLREGRALRHDGRVRHCVVVPLADLIGLELRDRPQLVELLPAELIVLIVLIEVCHDQENNR